LLRKWSGVTDMIPNEIHCINFEDGDYSTAPWAVENIARFGDLNPDYTVTVHTPASTDRPTGLPDRLGDLYDNLRFMASRADLWRYCILRERGGVYLDIDWHLLEAIPDLTAETIPHLLTGGGANGVIFSPAGHPLWDTVLSAKRVGDGRMAWTRQLMVAASTMETGELDPLFWGARLCDQFNWDLYIRHPDLAPPELGAVHMLDH